MFYSGPPGLGFLILAVVGCYVLWRYARNLPDHLAELRRSRERMDEAERQTAEDLDQLREEYRGNLTAFVIVAAIMAFVLLLTISFLLVTLNRNFW